MTVSKFIVIFVLLAVITLFHSSRVEAAPQQGDEKFSPPIYSYSYEAVDSDSGNQYGHGEERDGEVTRGEYRVLMPDGKTQVVRYSVEGEGGFQAEVSYEKK